MKKTLQAKIKDWKTLENEYGLDRDGDIAMLMSFTTTMEKLLPENRVVVVVDLEGDGEKSSMFLWLAENEGKHDSSTIFTITSEMIDCFVDHGDDAEEHF